MRRSLAIALSLSISPAPAAAEVIRHDRNGVTAIQILGTITPADEKAFRDLSVKIPEALVILSGPGGALVPALEIGKLVRLRGYDTVVLSDDSCSSACALIWMAGARRWLPRTSRIGFHASYLDKNGRKEPAAVGNALVGRYLTLLEYPQSTIVFATQAPPDSIQWMTREIANRAAISYEVWGEDEDTASPSDRQGNSEVEPPASTSDSGYRKIGSSSGAVHTIRADRLRKLPGTNLIEVWIEGEHSKDKTVDFRRSIQLWHLDCTRRQYAVLSYTTYSARGELLTSDEFPAKWDRLIPDSVADLLGTQVCERN